MITQNYGRIRTPANPLRVNARDRLASRIANIAIPARAQGMFPRHLKRQIERYGMDFGLATPPAWFRDGMTKAQGIQAASLSELIPTTIPTTDALQRVQSRMQFMPRDQMANGVASLVPSPGTMGPPIPGIASTKMEAAQTNALDHSSHPHGPNGECYGGTQAEANWQGQSAAEVRGNPALAPEMVDDSSWPVKLSQILGSRVLSQEQLQFASIQNISKMVRIDGGSESDRMTMAYLMQRMILEGMIRGVDYSRELQGYSGGIRVQLTDGAVCSSTSTGTVGCGGMGYVQFRKSYWNSVDDAGKLALFYHEMGHEIMGKGHTSGIMNAIVPRSINNNYLGLMNQLFNGQAPRTGSNNAIDTVLQQNPDWFPSATGVSTPPVGGPNPPGGPNAPPSAPPNTNVNVPIGINNPVDVRTFNIAPPSVNPWVGGGSNITSSRVDSSTPESAAHTPVAGMLPDMASVYSFGAGLQSTMNRAQSTLQGLAGALTRFRTG